VSGGKERMEIQEAQSRLSDSVVSEYGIDAGCVLRCPGLEKPSEIC